MVQYARSIKGIVRMLVQLFRISLLILCCVCSSQLIAGPWLSSGEPWSSSATSATKSDVDLLASYGFIKAPVLSWPIAWDAIEESLLSEESKKRIKTAPQAVQLAYFRLVSQYEAATQRQLKGEMFVSGGSNINPFRTFDYQPRSDINSGVEFEKQGDNWAGKAALSYGKYNDVTQPMHLDDTYAYGFFHLGPLGKWGLGVDKMPRWWSPSYVDSLILSNNAPPLPTLTLQRMNAEAFQTKWLKWIGPWSFTTSLSRGDPNGPVAHPLIWLTNFSFRPIDSLQFSFSRVAFFAGDSRPLNWTMLKKLLVVDDNCSQEIYSNPDYCQLYTPGTEHAELTVSWRTPFKISSNPITLYLHTIFNDMHPISVIELPWRTSFLAGANSTVSLFSGYLRPYIEYEYLVQHAWWFWDLSDKLTNKFIIYDIYGYSNYPYTYYGKIIGSPLGGESQAINLGGVYVQPDGNDYTLQIRYLHLNPFGFNSSGYPFERQDVLWTSVGRNLFLSSKLGKLSGQVGYISSIQGQGLSSSFSFNLTWSRSL